MCMVQSLLDTRAIIFNSYYHYCVVHFVIIEVIYMPTRSLRMHLPSSRN